MQSGRMNHPMRLIEQRPVVIILALVVAWLGLWTHELYRVPSVLGLTLDGSLPPLAIAILLLTWWFLAVRKRAPTRALLLFAFINCVGGFLSVLPLPFLPFVPEQVTAHYLVHMLYVICQVPLIMVTFATTKQAVNHKLT